MFKTKLIPILFSTMMVQAILRFIGPKLVTRRTTGLKEVNKCPDSFKTVGELFVNENGKLVQQFISNSNIVSFCQCPYGRPGDILWVREGFHQYGRWSIGAAGKREWHPLKSETLRWLADGPAPDKPVKGLEGSMGYQWRTMPSIHLKREHARIYLKVKSIRVERLQDIDDLQAIAEGIESKEFIESGELVVKYRDYTCNNEWYHEPESSFQSLWMSINGCTSWYDNPWVWVVEFERTEKPEEVPNVL